MAYQPDNGTPVVRGKTPYEAGRNSALKSGARIKALVKALSGLARRSGIAPERMGADHKGSLQKEILLTETLDEFRGLGDALSTSIDDLFKARRLLESLFVPFCTNFGALPPAVHDGGILLSWNFDAPPILKLLMGRFPLHVREIGGKIPCLCLGVPSLFGIGILNAEGLCQVVNAVGIRDDGDGLSPFELNSLAMERCSTVEEAARVFQANPRKAIRSMTIGTLMNWNVIWADRSGSLSVFEYSHNHFHREKASENGIIASTNHHQFLDRSKTGSYDPLSWRPIAGSYSRLARVWKLLMENAGMISPAVAKTINSDHMPDYSLLREFGVEREWWEEKPDNSTICAHAWNLRKHVLKREFEEALLEISMSTTLYSIQIQPERMTVWFTCGHPCRNTTLPFYFGHLLGTGRKEEPFPSSAVEISRVKRLDCGRGIFGSERTRFGSILNRAWFDLIRAVERSNFKKWGDNWLGL